MPEFRESWNLHDHDYGQRRRRHRNHYADSYHHVIAVATLPKTKARITDLAFLERTEDINFVFRSSAANPLVAAVLDDLFHLHSPGLK